MRFLLVAGFAESILTFRGPLIEVLLACGINVHVAAPHLPIGSDIRMALELKGLVVHSIPMLRTGMNPLADLQTFWVLWRVMRRVRPEFVLSYTVKPVIYGSLAAWLVGVPQRFALVTGLGYAFQGEGQRGRLQALVQRLYALALSRVDKVFFQNPDDAALFRQRGILAVGTPSCVVNGSGVDVGSFTVTSLPPGPPRFLLIARLLGD